MTSLYLLLCDGAVSVIWTGEILEIMITASSLAMFDYSKYFICCVFEGLERVRLSIASVLGNDVVFTNILGSFLRFSFFMG